MRLVATTRKVKNTLGSLSCSMVQVYFHFTHDGFMNNFFVLDHEYGCSPTVIISCLEFDFDYEFYFM